MMNLPEEIVQGRIKYSLFVGLGRQIPFKRAMFRPKKGTHNTEEGFLRRLALFNALRSEEDTGKYVLNSFGRVITNFI